MPVGHLDLRFRAVNDRLAKCDRKADGRVLDLIVVGVVVDVTQIVVDVGAQVVAECLGDAGLVVVALRRLDRELAGNPGLMNETSKEFDSRMFSKDGVWKTRS